MADQNELDRLYAEAKSALKKREYDRATGLLTQILVIDENYKDVPRLLAQTVKLKRRKWYNHPVLWSGVGFILLVGLGIGLLKFLPQQTVTITQPVESTVTPSMTVVPATATVTLTPTATPIPLTWKRISMGQEFERDSVSAFATDKKDSEVIYAAMKNSGVYKTIDGGISWFPSHNGMSNTQVESLVIDSQNPQILYASTMGGIFKTENGGKNWFRIGDGIYLLMDLQNNSHIYAHDNNGIYETTNQGNTWATVYILKKDCPAEIHSWAIHPKDGKMLFIGGGGACVGIYQSSDNGHSWALAETKDKYNLNALAIGLDEQGNYFIHTCFDALAADPANPSTIYCANDSGGLMYLQGKGSADQRMGLERFDLTAIHVDHPNGMNRIIVGGTRHYSHLEDGILISTDGGISWNKRGNGMGGLRSELKIDPFDSTRIYLATYTGRNQYKFECTLYRSPDNGKNWILSRIATWCGPSFGADNGLYIMEQSALQISLNGGETWRWGGQDQFYWPAVYKFALPSFYQGGSASVSANPYIEGLVYDIGDIIYYLTGSDWQKSSHSDGLRDAMLFYTDQSKMIYAIGRTHQSYSTDNGKTWQNCGQDVTTSRSDTRLALDLQGSRLYLVTPGQGVLISTDQCQSWQASNNGLTNLFVNTLAIDPNNIKTVYAGTDGGAYISYDAGATWGQVNDGLLGATVVYSIAVDKESNVYAATPYGIFQLVSK